MCAVRFRTTLGNVASPRYQVDAAAPARAVAGPEAWRPAFTYLHSWQMILRHAAEGEPVRRYWPLRCFLLMCQRRKLRRLLMAAGWTAQEQRSFILSMRAAAHKFHHFPPTILPALAC